MSEDIHTCAGCGKKLGLNVHRCDNCGRLFVHSLRDRLGFVDDEEITMQEPRYSFRVQENKESTRLPKTPKHLVYGDSQLHETGSILPIILSVYSPESSEAHFVVHTDGAGKSWIQFGDAENGKRLPENANVICAYRIGTSTTGKIKHDSISSVVMIMHEQDWIPASETDLDLVLIELISAAADELSDYQDRVMNEAYLVTKRNRTSLSRHARLVDMLDVCKMTLDELLTSYGIFCRSCGHRNDLRVTCEKCGDPLF